MMDAAIDACERIEAAGCAPGDRDATVEVGGRTVSVHDLLVSAWTYPENIRYAIVRDRHERGNDLPYVPESARILVAMAEAGAELISAGETVPAEAGIRRMLAWFEGHLPDSVEAALAGRRKA